MTAYNLSTAATTSTADVDESSAKCHEFWQTDTDDDRVVDDSSACAERDVEDASCVLRTDLFSDDNHATAAAAVAAVSVGNSDTVGNSDQTVVSKHIGLPQHSSATDEGRLGCFPCGSSFFQARFLLLMPCVCVLVSAF